MTIWFDAHLPPVVAKWLNADFPQHTFLSVWATGNQKSSDKVLFDAAKEANVLLISKDIDMVYLHERFGSPPKLMWLTMGNCTKQELYSILKNAVADSILLFEDGENFIEIDA